MDVQMENTDPPPCESQPSGKIRKGFRLFGKRKPGNIFSMRNKGEGNNKAPVIRSKTLDGLSESSAGDSEQEPNKENGHEVSQGEQEQAEEEPISDDAVLAAGPARASISSSCSAKSLSFLSLLRGGRKGTGSRRVHTLSQPVARQRRGLKGLFGNVISRSKDKEEKEEPPPSPLLMSSRSNSVEIIKEDITLTPRPQPRSLNNTSCETLKSSTTLGSAAVSPSKTGEHVPALPSPGPPLAPGDNSLSSLLEDISSLLTFESISGGDIMADVEAEWGKASSGLSVAAPEVAPSFPSPSSRPAVPPTLTAPAVSSATVTKPSPAAPPQTFKSLTNTTSSPKSKPSSIFTTFTKSSTLPTDSLTPALVSSSTAEVSNTKMKCSTAPSSHLTSSNVPPPETSWKSSPSSTSTTTTTTTTFTKPASMAKVTSATPTPFSAANKLPSEMPTPPAVTSPVSKPSPVASLTETLPRSPPVTQSPPISTALTQPPPAKLRSDTNVPTAPTYKHPLSSAAAGEPRGTASLSSTEPTKPSVPVQAISKATPPPAPSTTAATEGLTKTTPTSRPVDLNKPPHTQITGTTLPVTTKAQPIPASIPSQVSTGSSEMQSTAKPTSAALSFDRKPPTHTPVPTTQAAVPVALSTTTSLSQASVPQYNPPTVLSHTSVKDFPAGVKVSRSHEPDLNPQIPVPVTSNLPTSSCLLTSASKDIPASVQIPVSQPRAPTAPLSSLPVSTAPPAVTSNGMGAQGFQTTLKTESNNEPQTSIQATPREKKTTQGKSAGLSKIPVVGGGKVGRPPVRDSQHVDDNPIRDLPTPVSEQVPHFNFQDDGSKDKTHSTGAKSPTSPQQKNTNSSARDTKIPVKHSVQPHTLSQSPQTKEPPRTKIPVSKVPVRRAGNKPAAAGGSSQRAK